MGRWWPRASSASAMQQGARTRPDKAWPLSRAPACRKLATHHRHPTSSASNCIELGDREPKRLGSSEIDDLLEFGWLLDRHVAGLLAPENPGNVNAGTAIRVCLARSIAQKAASRDKLAFRVA